MSAYREDDLYVLNEAVIEKNGVKISLGDLSLEEEITVRYRLAPEGRKEVNHIWVKNSEE